MATAASLKRSVSAPARTAILASADLSFRQRVKELLTGLHWQVREAAGGAEALSHLDASPAEVVILDSWLPDLELQEFIGELEHLYPAVDLVAVNGTNTGKTLHSLHRNEIHYALCRAQDDDRTIGNSASVISWAERVPKSQKTASAAPIPQKVANSSSVGRLSEFIGNHPSMLEVSWRVCLVAQRRTAVLVQGPTGTGKELVARAIHRLSTRASKPFVALNCAAIPEALLEAELFGHTRGAFTGAVQGRVGRIEAAHRGTLFLDEIGEMPLPFQAKLLRFVEHGELQRVGENEPMRVDVRIVAATNQSLAKLVSQGAFRADLYYRLSVFLVKTPPLSAHKEDIPFLVQHFVGKMAEENQSKSVTADAMEKLVSHDWPGNVRELEHVLERAWILAGETPLIGADEIEFGEQVGDL